EIDMFVDGLLLALFLPVADPDPAALHLDRGVDRMRETRTFLDQAVADELEPVALREDGSLVVARAIAETKYHAARDPVAADGLDQVAGRPIIPVQRAQHEKAPGRALGMFHRHRLRLEHRPDTADDQEPQCRQAKTVQKQPPALNRARVVPASRRRA